MLQRRLDFERLNPRELCAIVGIGAEDSSSDRRVTVPVTIDDSTGVRAAEVRLRYDPETWSVEPAAIKTGSAWVRGGSAMANVDAEAGEITVFVFAAIELPGDQGSLIDLEFSPHDPAVNDSPAIELKSVRLNEGAIDADLNYASDLVNSDYINPRVRAKQAAATLIPLAVEIASRFPRLSRDRNAPMGPLPLTTEPAVPTIIVAPGPQPVSLPPSSPPATPWMLMFAEDDLRARKRAA